METITVYPQGGGYTGWVLTEQHVRVCITTVYPAASQARERAERFVADPESRARFNAAWAGQYSLPGLEE